MDAKQESLTARVVHGRSLFVTGLLLFVASCSSESKPTPIVDASLTASQAALLDLAIDSASKMPLDPHHKSRATAQELVVIACFELGAPNRALRYAQRIENWRRGVALADYAGYCLERESPVDVEGQPINIDYYLEAAEAVARATAAEPHQQGWRVESIRARIAKAYMLMGDLSKSSEFQAGVPDSEMGAIADGRAILADEDTFAKELAVLETVVASANFDRMRAAQQGMLRLYERFYSDVQKRELIEAQIDASLEQFPVNVRVDLFVALSEVASAQEDDVRALSHADRAEAIFEMVPWRPHLHVPALGAIAKARALAGAVERARSDCDAAMKIYQSQLDEIQNFDRNDALLPVAAAYHAAGSHDRALATYKRAVDEAVVNPNARPRCNDIVPTCCSLALNGIEPDEELMGKILSASKGLGAPW